MNWRPNWRSSAANSENVCCCKFVSSENFQIFLDVTDPHASPSLMFYFFMLLLWTFGWFFLSSPLGMCFFLHVSLSLSISLRLLLNVSGTVRQIVFNGGVKAAFQLLNKAYPTRTQTRDQPDLYTHMYIEHIVMKRNMWNPSSVRAHDREDTTLPRSDCFPKKHPPRDDPSLATARTKYGST